MDVKLSDNDSMAKIPRFILKIFGGDFDSSPAGKIAAFGSLAAGSPQFSSDPTTIQSFAGWVKGWTGAFIPGSQQSPTHEDFTGLLLVLTKAIKHIQQMGVSEWIAGEEYYVNSIVSSGGQLYRSLINNNTQPLDNTSAWSTLVDGRALAKGFCSFNGTGGVSLGNVYNVSGVVRNGTGDYTVTWQTPFADSNYCVVIQTGDSSSTLADFTRIVSKDANSVRFRSIAKDSAVADSKFCNVVAFAT